LQWELKELLYEMPVSALSKGVRHPHFRIVLEVNWRKGGFCSYVLRTNSSPTLALLERKNFPKKALDSARILAKKVKDSQGNYHSKFPELIDQQYL
jgi:DTW domain-containing protein YfiP